MTIFAEILKTTKESRRGKKKTVIMQSVNLNYHQANRYLHWLLTNGLLHIDGENIQNNKKRIRTYRDT